MGLPVARRLVVAHNGNLRMRSADGQVVVEITLRAAGERIIELPPDTVQPVASLEAEPPTSASA
jgi:hypothetical protein